MDAKFVKKLASIIRPASAAEDLFRSDTAGKRFLRFHDLIREKGSVPQ